jgi:hypothetical protein
MAKTKKITEADIELPYEIVDAFNAIKQNLNSNEFSLESITRGNPFLVSYSKENEKVLLEIKNEDITVRHYSVSGDTRKLKALYVQKNANRTFKLLN